MCKCPSAASRPIPRGDWLRRNFWVLFFLPTLLKLLGQLRQEPVPAVPMFSKLLITIQPLLVFPDFKDRHHMNGKKLKGKIVYES